MNAIGINVFKKKKIYFKREKVLHFEREQYEYVICPTCNTINKIILSPFLTFLIQ